MLVGTRRGIYPIHRHHLDSDATCTKRWQAGGSRKANPNDPYLLDAKGTQHRIPWWTEQLAAKPPAIRISHRAYDELIHKWNHLLDRDRRERMVECSRDGHDYGEAPYSTDADPSYICRRCLNRSRLERKAA